MHSLFKILLIIQVVSACAMSNNIKTPKDVVIKESKTNPGSYKIYTCNTKLGSLKSTTRYTTSQENLTSLFCVYMCDKNIKMKRTATIEKIKIYQLFQKQGYASLLLNHFIQECKDLGINAIETAHIEESNKQAKSLFEKFCFRLHDHGIPLAQRERMVSYSLDLQNQ
jgi:hypothetical protein